MREPRLARPVFRPERQNLSTVVIIAEITQRQRSEILRILQSDEKKARKQ